MGPSVVACFRNCYNHLFFGLYMKMCVLDLKWFFIVFKDYNKIKIHHD